MALPEDRNIDVSKFPDQVQKFLSPQAPTQMKLMVARGMVPMQPVVQVCSLYQLCQTGESEVVQAAVQTLRKLPAQTLKQTVAQPLFPVVLDWLAEVFVNESDVVRVILLNKNTDNDTFVRVAAKADEETCELIARNQQRLLEAPKIIAKLYFNRALRASTADRMIDFAARNEVDLSDIPAAKEIIAAIQGIELPSEEEARAADERFKAAQKILASVPEDVDLDDRLDLPEHEEEPEEVRSGRSAAGLIRDMNIAQKLRLAMMGGKNERSILIRDTNKLVARSVIRSPAIGDSEVMLYAANKSLLDEIIAYIARNKKWTRSYQMKLILINNPKTPTSEAMTFLRHLRVADLRQVAKSKNVPGPIAKAAKQMTAQRR